MRCVSLSFVLVGFSACSFPRLQPLAGADPGDAAAIDSRTLIDAAAADSATPGPDGCASFATLLALDTCQLAFAGDLIITGGTVVYDTGMHRLTFGSSTIPITHTAVTLAGESVEVISARSVTFDVILFGVLGPLPLVIAASTDIRVGDGALLDVSNGSAGARTSCVNGASPGAPDTGGGAGGGGGGYGAAGGAGGNGDSDTGPSIGGSRGAAVATLPAGLRGGCPGASGGGGGGVAGGAGGSAGGALYLVAAGRIELGSSTVVHAGGGAGMGGPKGNAGGGGGGSGGMLLLESPHIIGPAATIAANGGGGGGGGDAAAAGEAGSAGTLTDARASGGRGTSSINELGAGIDGGKGGSKQSPTGEDVTAIKTGGGGGGGGGVGIIRIKSADLQVRVVSPEPR